MYFMYTEIYGIAGVRCSVIGVAGAWLVLRFRCSVGGCSVGGVWRCGGVWWCVGLHVCVPASVCAHLSCLAPLMTAPYSLCPMFVYIS